MLRTSLVLAALSFSACAFNDDGQLILCTKNHCPIDTDPPPSTTPPTPISFSYDNGTYQAANQLAADGVMQLRVESLGVAVTEITSTGDAFALSVLSSAPHLTELEVVGVHAGSGTIAATIPSFGEPARFGIYTADVASFGVAIEYGPVRDRLVVLGDIRAVSPHLLSAETSSLVDHSLAIDLSSDAGFTQTSWDVISLPETPGERVLALTRRSGSVHHASIRTVDHVDTIVADLLDPAGRLCVHAEVDGEPVETLAWQFTGNDKLVTTEAVRPDCVDFFSATPGATISVTLAGTTTEFVVVP